MYDVISSGVERRAPRITPKVMIAIWILSVAIGIAWCAGMIILDSR
jgi:hypothetical protein